jgi:hypothetical protein
MCSACRHLHSHQNSVLFSDIYHYLVNSKEFVVVVPPLKRPLSAYSHYLGENPEVGTHFKPEPPYDIYTRGVVHYNKSHGRRLVDLYTPAVENNGVSIKTNVVLVSTYLFQVLYWKLYGLLIPTGYQVDHR